ncbi:MAG: AtpZ/AtpI family protein [Candidatus Auribacterota bacterium]
MSEASRRNRIQSPEIEDGKKKQSVWNQETFRVFLVVSNLGFVMVFSILFSFLIGIYLDKFFQKDYIFVIIFLILGIMSGFYQCYRILKKELKL